MPSKKGKKALRKARGKQSLPLPGGIICKIPSKIDWAKIDWARLKDTDTSLWEDHEWKLFNDVCNYLKHIDELSPDVILPVRIKSGSSSRKTEQTGKGTSKSTSHFADLAGPSTSASSSNCDSHRIKNQEQSSSAVESTTSVLANTPQNKSSPPPIVIHEKAIWRRFLDLCKSNNVTISYGRNSQNGMRVTIPTVLDHKNLTRVLDDNRIAFFTYTLPEEKKLRVVIRDLPKEIVLDEIKEELLLNNFPVVEVHRMRNRKRDPIDMVMVVLDPSPEAREIFKLKTVCDLTIKVEPAYKPNYVRQCHRCQLYGHAARKCRLQPRCVKCAGEHLTQNCTRPQDTLEPPSCALCGQVGHPANYRGCPKVPLFYKEKTG